MFSLVFAKRSFASVFILVIVFDNLLRSLITLAVSKRYQIVKETFFTLTTSLTKSFE